MFLVTVANLLHKFTLAKSMFRVFRPPLVSVKMIGKSFGEIRGGVAPPAEAHRVEVFQVPNNRDQIVHIKCSASSQKTVLDILPPTGVRYWMYKIELLNVG